MDLAQVIQLLGRTVMQREGGLASCLLQMKNFHVDKFSEQCKREKEGENRNKTKLDQLAGEEETQHKASKADILV